MVGIVGTVVLVVRSDTRDVLIASRPIPAYHQLTEADFDVYPMPVRRIEEGAVESMDTVVGRYLTTPLNRQEPVSTVDLGPKLDPNVVSGPVVAFPVSPESTLGGQITRGDRAVAIVETGNDVDAPDNPVVWDDVLVLDITAGAHPAVVLAISPAQLDVLTAAGRQPRSVFVARTQPYGTSG